MIDNGASRIKSFVTYRISTLFVRLRKELCYSDVYENPKLRTAIVTPSAEFFATILSPLPDFATSSVALPIRLLYQQRLPNAYP